MKQKNFLGTMKRALAGILVVGMVLTGMPVVTVEAANEIPGQTQPEQEISTPEDLVEKPDDGIGESGESNPGSEDTESGEEKPDDGTDESGNAEPGDETDESDAVNPGDDDNGFGDDQEEESQPGAEDEEAEPGEEQTEDGDDLDAVYSAQVFRNDISGNDLMAYMEEVEEGTRVVGGYIELPEDRDVSVVDESARIYDYEDEIAPLMSDALPAQYIPEKGTLPLTRNQNPYGSCWAHSAMTLAETDMMKNGGAPSNVDYSELHLAYFSYSGAVDDPLGGLYGDANYCTGDTFMDQGGNLALAQNVLTNWVGAADESTAPYSQAADALKNGLSKELAFTDVAHLQNAFQINLQENPEIAKRMIQKYGGVGTSYCDAEKFYNSANNSYYCDTKFDTNHAVTIVGWDDSFSADQFNTKPEGDGAWLIRNSWVAGQDTDARSRYTYFWMSYYDKSLAAGYAFDFEDAENYHHNYQYDGSMQTRAMILGTGSYAANVFTAKAYEGGERLDAVGLTFWKAQTPYVISIYKNLKDETNPESGELIEEATTSGTCGCEGFYTIPLANSVSLAENDTFSVVVQYGAPEKEPDKVYVPFESTVNGWYRCETAAKEGQSFYKYSEYFGWQDFGKEENANLRIKAYTMDDDGGTGLPTKIELNDDLKKGIEVGVGDTYQAACTVLPRSALDRTVRWESDEPSVATVDTNGLITGVSDGTATITVSCNADASVKASFSVEVYSDLRSIQITGASYVTAGETLALQTVRSPSSVSAANVQWSSSDERVLTVDANGVVTGVAPGYATVTAGIGDVKGTKEMTCEFPDFSYHADTSIKGITLTWPGGSGATKYQIYRVVGESWTNPKLLATVTADGRDSYSYLDENVVANNKYIYGIEATVNYIKGNGIEEKTVSSDLWIWTMPEFYSITYHLNGGENNSNNPTYYRVGYSTYIRNPLTREGYTFTGWYLDESLTQKLESWYLPSTMTGNLDLYAGWKPIVYRITYELDGGTNSRNNPSEYMVTTDFVLESPTKDGYDFQGWYTDSLFKNRIKRIASDTTTGKDMTLYAKWSVHSYRITYMLNGGTNSAENPETYTIEDAVIILKDAVKEGTTFEGWYSDLGYRQKVEQIMPEDKRDITLFAKWQGEETPLITDIEIKRPTRTTYKIGEALDVSGGEVTLVSDESMVPIPMSAEMISGFDSSAPGICRVTVSFEGFHADFETLVVEEPRLIAFYGQQLKKLTLPTNEYGVYSWVDEEMTLTQEGICNVPVSFIPNDEDVFQRLDDLYAQITVEGASTDGALAFGVLTLGSESLVYTGAEQKPAVTLTLKGALLEEGKDYTITYHNNKDVGMATVVAEGIGDYHGSLSKSFAITPAGILIKAKNKTILIGGSIPHSDDYEYEVSGLLMDDSLITEPVFSCDITEADTKKAGRFTITPSAADAGPNYTITYEKGQLTVASEYLVYSVVFDVQGHGMAPEVLYDVKAGSTIDAPEEPSAQDYTFAGWCKDAACTKDWNFDADIVQSDITLYAKWLKKSAQTEFQLQEIEDIYYYTGKAWKPVVNVYDGETMLKAGRDYTVKYFNNINANAGGVWKKGSGQGADFNSDIPYVQITGKGNYTDEVKVNFDIHPAVIADENGKPAEKAVLKYTDQFVAAKKVLKPFGSIKCGKAMRLNQDYELTLTAVDVRDGSGMSVPSGTKFDNAAIPVWHEGEFMLTVTGIGNYVGSISKSVHVTDKLHLMKNAKITLGKNQKSMELVGRSVKLTPSTKDSADTFTVKFGKTVLTPEQDYKVSYLDKSNERVGKATLVITGVGDYSGTKTASFTVRGKAFTAGKITVTGIENKVYTGRAITQNDAVLVYNVGGPDEKELKYGTDYTISYAKNINKGTAIMTFTGSKEQGFNGSFKKTFKISAVSIDTVNRGDGWDTIAAEYRKEGAKPVSEIVLTNAGGIRLRNGKDYTLSYKNNKLVADVADEKAPTIIVKGKGNYQGSFSIPFKITGADLRTRIRNGEITVKTTAVAYQQNKSGDYAYKPAVKLMEGKKALRAGTDYTITYINNTQADYEAYIENIVDADAPAMEPSAVIAAGSDNTYLISSEPISVPLTIYRNKLTKANLQVRISEPECVYTGTQVTPNVVVSYKAGDDWIPLTKDKDYTVTYGANVKSGKKAGRVTISGIGTFYGGDVTVNFEISRKKIKY